jgi:hypothetical protein
MDPGFRRDDDRGEDGVGCDDGHFFLPKKDFVSSEFDLIDFIYCL